MVLDLDNTCRLLLNDGKLFGIRRALNEHRRRGVNQPSMLTADSSRHVNEIALRGEISQHAGAQGWTRSAGAARRGSMVRARLSLQTLNEQRDARYLDSPTAVGELT